MATGHRSSSSLVELLLLLATCSCGGSSVPDPKQAASEYAAAVKDRDAEALYRLLDREGRRALGQEQVRELLDRSHAELQRRARAFAGPEAEVQTRAELRFADGEVVSLKLEDGQFRLSSATALPSGANTPVQALHELRAALARRSYRGLLLVLSNERRASVEGQMEEIVSALDQPETLDIVVVGERATVSTPGGHRVELVNENGNWKIRDFE